MLTLGNFFLSTFFLLNASYLLSQEAVVSQGDNYSNPNANINFSIGEVVISTVSDGNYYLTQGFHQTNWNFVGLEDLVPTYEVKVYPNPTSEFLYINTKDFNGVSYFFYDSKGKLILQNSLSSTEDAVNVSQLSTGTYYLVLADKNQKLKSFQLIKTF